MMSQLVGAHKTARLQPDQGLVYFFVFSLATASSHAGVSHQDDPEHPGPCRPAGERSRVLGDYHTRHAWGRQIDSLCETAAVLLPLCDSGLMQAICSVCRQIVVCQLACQQREMV